MSSGPEGERWGRVAVRCFGRYWLLRDVPASVWIQAAVTEDLSGIFPGLVDDDDAEEILSLWLTEPDMRARCVNVSRKALERAAGGEWHWALNMINECRDAWTHLNGKLVREGVRADQTRLSDYLDAAYTLFSELLGKDEKKAFEQRLRKIPGSASTARPRMSSRADLLAFAAD